MAKLLAGARVAGRHRRDVERLLDRRVLGAVDEAGEVATVAVDPAPDLADELARPA